MLSFFLLLAHILALVAGSNQCYFKLAMVKTCYCGGVYTATGVCGQRDCPKSLYGRGHWHVALPALTEMHNRGQLMTRYPQMDFYGLRAHVRDMEAKRGNRSDRPDHVNSERYRQRYGQQRPRGTRGDRDPVDVVSRALPLRQPQEEPQLRSASEVRREDTGGGVNRWLREDGIEVDRRERDPRDGDTSEDVSGEDETEVEARRMEDDEEQPQPSGRWQPRLERAVPEREERPRRRNERHSDEAMRSGGNPTSDPSTHDSNRYHYEPPRREREVPPLPEPAPVNPEPARRVWRAARHAERERPQPDEAAGGGIAAKEEEPLRGGRRVKAEYRPAQEDWWPDPARGEAKSDDEAPPPGDFRSPERAAAPVKQERASGSGGVGSGTEHADAAGDGLSDVASNCTEDSLYGLRGRDFSDEGDDLSQGSGPDSTNEAECERVKEWRVNNLLEEPKDFAFCFSSFAEAYEAAGRAVAAAWSRARMEAEPLLCVDEATIARIAASSEVLRGVDNKRIAAAHKKNLQGWARRGNRVVEEPNDPTVEEKLSRFSQLLVDVMVESLRKPAGSNATSQENLNSLMRRADRVVKASEVPTLHRAVTTAGELRDALQARQPPIQFKDLEAAILENFLWEHKSKSRATSAVTWLVRNCALDWPIENIEKPVVSKASVVGLDSEQAAVAQPCMLFALEDAAELAAEQNSSTWLALLGSWLQAAGDMRLVHVLRRSFPVERYPQWVLFFCTRGKQRHNRSGFYWGVPTQFSSGYDWTVKFFEVYEARRAALPDEKTPGICFEVGSWKYIAAVTINNISMRSVSEVVDNPERLTTYSWRRMVPTLAFRLGFDAKERLAVGDWKDNSRARDEAPITLRYAEGKAGMSRHLKMVLHSAFSDLRKRKLQDWDDLPEATWQIVAKQSREAISEQVLSTEPVWRNPELVEGDKGFKVKEKSSFPASLNGVPLMPRTRMGEKFCAEYQADTCTRPITEVLGGHPQACAKGLHRCAAEMRGGRACLGRHPGSQCQQKRRHAKPFDAAEPPAKKAKPGDAAPKPKFKVHPGPKPRVNFRDKAEEVPLGDPQQPMPKAPDRAPGKRIACGYSDEHFVARKNELMEKKPRMRGNRIEPEDPTLIAKVRPEPGKGEIWLGGLPTDSRMRDILGMDPSIQVGCFKKHPHENWVDNSDRCGTQGRYIPNTQYFKLEMSNPKVRPADFRRLRDPVMNSLAQGDNVYIHCISGLSRGPVGGAVLSAMAMNISFERAMRHIEDVRNIKRDDGEERMEGQWINDILSEGYSEWEAAPLFICSTARPTQPPLVHVGSVTWPGGMGPPAQAEVYPASDQADTPVARPACRWKQKRGEALVFKGSFGVARSVAESQRMFGGDFCCQCYHLAKCSVAVEVDRVYGFGK